MRGAPPVASADARQERIIPADAGSTWRRGEAPVRSRDHPRRCGEHDGLIAFGRGCGGSFPQMRGARVWPSPSATRTGIIPADAGSTTPCGGWAWWTTDHPRRCGEHSDLGQFRDGYVGSSPRMRGAPVADAPEAETVRIIPADAGSTLALIQVTPAEWDHPRGCGEHK